MATLSPPSAYDKPLPGNENQNPSRTNILWSSTPRTTRSAQELELLMAAQQVVPQASNNAPQKTSRHVQRGAAAPRLPTCTHMSMDRRYGEHTCSMCGQIPSIGWLYSCQQDRLQQQQQAATPEVEVLPVVADDGNYFEAQAKVAESLGMSRSVIQQMRCGEYTFDQMEILLQQRRHVLDVIKKTENPSTSSTPSHSATPSRPSTSTESIIASHGAAAPAVQYTHSAQLPMSAAGTPMNTPASSTATTPIKLKKTKKPVCTYQVCHACRPFLQDRLPMSVGLVLSNEAKAVTENEMAQLPMLDPGIVRGLGKREPNKVPPELQTQDITDAQMHQGDGQDEDSEDWTPSSATSSAFYSDESEDPTPCPGPGICPLTDESGICAYDVGFDDGKRAYHHQDPASFTPPSLPPTRLQRSRGNLSIIPAGPSSSKSSISLPETRTEPLTPSTPGAPALELESSGKLRPAIKPLAVMPRSPASRSVSRHSNSSRGSEVEVEGGVALTEEAVERGSPDIVDG